MVDCLLKFISDVSNLMLPMAAADYISTTFIVFLAGEGLIKPINLNFDCILFILGYNGWFPVNIPVRGWGTEEETNTAGNQQDENGLNRVGGGLEITVKFAHHDDRERVIHAARGVGWSPIDIDVEQDGWQSEG